MKDPVVIGSVIVDILIVRRAALSPANEVPALQSPEERKRIEAAEQRLANLSGLELTRALIEYSRVTGAKLKI